MKTLRFGKLEDGREAGLYIIESHEGMRAAVTDYGAALVSLAVPDKNGVMRDVVLGYDDAAGYAAGGGHFGSTVGRFANRIDGARFELNGKEYALTANDGTNCLHGGRDHFKDRLWNTKVGFTSVRSGDIMSAYAAESIADRDPVPGLRGLNDNKIIFYIDSPDGDQGFPGSMHIEVTYSLPGNGELRIEYKAVTDADTPVNFTNHSYFNLNGHESGTVLRHLAKIYADRFAPVNENHIPYGEPLPVDGTAFDFRSAKPLGLHINADDEQIRLGGGYDHDYIINGSGFRDAAVLWSEESGIMMEVLTDMPEMQLYTANFLDNEPGKDGVNYGKRSAVCFETQFRPDAVNSKDESVRESCILKAGKEFTSVTTYRFSTPEE